MPDPDPPVPTDTVAAEAAGEGAAADPVAAPGEGSPAAQGSAAAPGAARRPGELSWGQVAAIVVPVLVLGGLWFANPSKTEYMLWLRSQNIYTGPPMAQAMQMAKVSGATTLTNRFLFTVFETHCEQPAVDRKALGIATVIVPLGGQPAKGGSQ